MMRIPLRTCIGCLQKRPKRELVRIIVESGKNENRITIDSTGRAKGRGTYLCRIDEEIEKIQSKTSRPLDEKDKKFQHRVGPSLAEKNKGIQEKITYKKECFDQALKKKAFNRAFHKEVEVNL